MMEVGITVLVVIAAFMVRFQYEASKAYLTEKEKEDRKLLQNKRALFWGEKESFDQYLKRLNVSPVKSESHGNLTVYWVKPNEFERFEHAMEEYTELEEL